MRTSTNRTDNYVVDLSGTTTFWLEGAQRNDREGHTESSIGQVSSESVELARVFTASRTQESGAQRAPDQPPLVCAMAVDDMATAAKLLNELRDLTLSRATYDQAARIIELLSR